jgi:hypothetical protein
MIPNHPAERKPALAGLKSLSLASRSAGLSASSSVSHCSSQLRATSQRARRDDAAERVSDQQELPIGLGRCLPEAGVADLCQIGGQIRVEPRELSSKPCRDARNGVAHRVVAHEQHVASPPPFACLPTLGKPLPRVYRAPAEAMHEDD